MEQHEAKKILNEVKESNSFTSVLTFEEYVEGLCKRYSRTYGEILNNTDYVTIVNKLKEKGDL